MSRAYISQALRTETVECFQGRCAYCRSPQKLMSTIYEVDHIIPEARGGATNSENLAYCCPQCNDFKASHTHAADPHTGRQVALFHPRQQNWFRHFAWSDDGLMIQGHTACGRATVEALKLNRADLQRLRFLWSLVGANPPDWYSPMIDAFQAKS